jgi:hypothetical protein
MGAITLRGLSGDIAWSYHGAAVLGPWTATSSDGGNTVHLTADVVSHDAYAVSQRPLTFVVQRPEGRQPWRWPVQTLQIVDAKLTAVLGPQE